MSLSEQVCALVGTLNVCNIRTDFWSLKMLCLPGVWMQFIKYKNELHYSEMDCFISGRLPVSKSM